MRGQTVILEPRSLREAEERAEADACSAVVSSAVIGWKATTREQEDFWAAQRARKRGCA